MGHWHAWTAAMTPVKDNHNQPEVVNLSKTPHEGAQQPHHVHLKDATTIASIKLQDWSLSMPSPHNAALVL
jgi:hypothetical protein